MKNIIIYSALSLLTNLSYGQISKDTLKQHIPIDSYDNFKRQVQGSSGHITIKDLTGKIIAEESLQNGQCPECYERLTKRADSFYAVSKINEAAALYSTAFKLNNNKAKVKDRLKAACCWAKLDDKDKAFDDLNRVVFNAKFYNANLITSENCYKSLYSDKRWKELLDGLQENIKAFQDKLNKETNQQ